MRFGLTDQSRGVLEIGGHRALTVEAADSAMCLAFGCRFFGSANTSTLPYKLCLRGPCPLDPRLLLPVEFHRDVAPMAPDGHGEGSTVCPSAVSCASGRTSAVRGALRRTNPRRWKCSGTAEFARCLPAGGSLYDAPPWQRGRRVLACRRSDISRDTGPLTLSAPGCRRA